jgi:hypothetical protein
MKKILAFCLFLTCTSNVKSQIVFEKGYFIDNDGIRTNCLIKNEDWKNSPKEFEYKLNEKADSLTQLLQNVKEFGIVNFSKYIKNDVIVEVSSNVVDKMNYNPALKTKKITAFLKVLVEGQASLMYYEQGEIRCFFAKIDTNLVQSLFYKEYLNDKTVKETAPFRQYLYTHLKCESINLRNIETLKYKEDDLVKLFEKYNNCLNPNSKTFSLKPKREKFNFKILALMNLHNFKFVGFNGKDYLISDNTLTPGFGFEMEDILPFNKNKWGLMAAPNIYFFNSSSQKANYVAFEIPIAIRNYFFLSSGNKIFLSVGINFNFPLIKTIKTDLSPEPTPVTNTACWLVSTGYSFKKWQFELRYYTTQHLFGDAFYAFGEYGKTNFILSYKF